MPYPAGGSVDVVARLLVQKLNESMGQNFIVENRAGGAGGAVGANVVAKAAPDGYTLMFTASIHIITPFLNSKIPYDAVKDFAPVSLVASGPLIVSTAPGVPASKLKELFDARAQGAGQIHLRDLELRLGRAPGGRAAQARCRRRYAGHRLQGRGPDAERHHGRADSIDRRPDGLLAAARPSGKIKALAVTSLKRVAAAPDIPTIAESGMTGFEFCSWYGLWGPKGLPADIAAKLQAEVAKAVATPEIKRRSGSSASRRSDRARRSSRSTSTTNPRSTARSSATRRSRRSDPTGGPSDRHPPPSGKG